MKAQPKPKLADPAWLLQCQTCRAGVRLTIGTQQSKCCTNPTCASQRLTERAR
jgi:hypothetical protein